METDSVKQVLAMLLMNNFVKNPVVSICCITFNQENYISETIKGFLMQKTTFPFEIIIHDDASTDNTAEIIREYVNKYPDLFITIFQTENQWSKGIRPSPTYVWPRARGKYIALCEGDDYWTDPLKLQKQMDFMKTHDNVSFCFHNAKTHFIDTNICEDFNKHLHSGYFTTKDLLIREWFIPTASLFIRRSFLPNPFPDWYNKIYSGDYALELILSTKGNFYYIDEKMSVYRKNAINSLSVNQVNSYNHLLKKIILLQGFAKSQTIKIRIIVNYAIIITRFQIFRAKIYSALPITFEIKNLLKRIILKKQQ